jgi:hypothetical protein
LPDLPEDVSRPFTLIPPPIFHRIFRPCAAFTRMNSAPVSKGRLRNAILYRLNLPAVRQRITSAQFKAFAGILVNRVLSSGGYQ